MQNDALFVAQEKIRNIIAQIQTVRVMSPQQILPRPQQKQIRALLPNKQCLSISLNGGEIVADDVIKIILNKLVTTTAAPMKVFTVWDNSSFTSATIHYLEHRSKIRNRNEMYRICNKMGLPTRYHAFSYPENPVDTPSHVWKFNSITPDNKILDDMGTLHGATVGTPSIVGSDGV